MKPLINIKDHQTKVAIVSLGVVIVLWDFIIVPVAASKGLILPIVTMDHIRAMAILVGL